MESWDLLALESPESRSPTVLHSSDARAIVLQLGPGETIGDHQVRERAWVTVVDGAVEISCGDERLAAPAGALVMFEPGERHSVSSTAGARLLLLLAPWPAPGHYPPRG